MTDLRDRFATFDDVEAPDLTHEIMRRVGEAPPPRPERRRRRLPAAVLALVLSVAAIALVVRAFRLAPTPSPRPGGAAAGEITAAAQGIGITWPESWTLVQLGGEVQASWPILQLTNYEPKLDGRLCPSQFELPSDGVLLYVQRNLEADVAALPEWPVSPDFGETSEGTCGVGTHIAWHSGDGVYEALLAVGADTSQADRALLLDAFSSLDFRRFPQGQEWHPKDPQHGGELDSRPIYEWPKFVAWGIEADTDTGLTVLVIPDLDGRWGGARTVMVGAGISADVGPEANFTPGERHVYFAGDVRGAFETLVHAYGFVSLEVDRLVIEADDGRLIEATIGPSLERYGVALKPTFTQFESPLLGRWVAYSSAGHVLERERYDNWPPIEEGAGKPGASPTPTEHERYRVPDAEAQAYREEVYAAIEGTLLLEGNNWNYAWVVYVTKDGDVIYRDGDSFGPVNEPHPHLGGTSFMWGNDPEVLYVGQASAEVEWFGVERADGSAIEGTVVPVPGSDTQVVTVTVRTLRSGDRFVVKDAEGNVLQELAVQIRR